MSMRTTADKPRRGTNPFSVGGIDMKLLLIVLLAIYLLTMAGNYLEAHDVDNSKNPDIEMVGKYKF